jgi:hypothetical protein
MLIAEAQVDTDRSARYLVQLCQHVDAITKRQPQMQARVEWSENHGLIDFGWARCVLRAEPGVLRLRAEAADANSLRQIEQRVAERLRQVGRRDGLTVTWAAPNGDAEQSPDTPPHSPPHQGGHGHGRSPA